MGSPVMAGSVPGDVSACVEGPEQGALKSSQWRFRLDVTGRVVVVAAFQAEAAGAVHSISGCVGGESFGCGRE